MKGFIFSMVIGCAIMLSSANANAQCDQCCTPVRNAVKNVAKMVDNARPVRRVVCAWDKWRPVRRFAGAWQKQKPVRRFFGVGCCCGSCSCE